MKPDDAAREENFARLTQEATNQSTPDKALDEQTRRRIPRRRIARKRSKAPDA